MKYAVKLLIIALNLTTASLYAKAENTPEKQADIKRLMDVTGAGDLGIQVMNQMIPMLKQSAPDIPDQFWVEFMGSVDVDKLVDLCIPSYEKYFTHEEIKELLKFYSTPLGKKMISAQPLIMQECMMAGQKWGQELALSATQKIQAYKAK